MQDSAIGWHIAKENERSEVSHVFEFNRQTVVRLHPPGILWVVSTTTLRQTVTPPSLLGRVSAINAVAYGARPSGAAIGALVGALYDAPTCLIMAAAGFLIQAIVILVSPVPRLARSPLPAAHDPS